MMRFKNQEEAAAHNVAKMGEAEAKRLLRWLQEQEAQPPLRVTMIRLLREKLSNQESKP